MCRRVVPLPQPPPPLALTGIREKLLGIQKEKFCGNCYWRGSRLRGRQAHGEKNKEKSTLHLEPERCLSSGAHTYSENRGESAVRAAAERRPDNDMIDERKRARGSDKGGRAAPPIATHLLVHTVCS